MSDEEERKLWRTASEQSPDVVRWVETRLRRMGVPQGIQIPKFTETYSNTMVIPACGVGYLEVAIPLNSFTPGQGGYPSFHLVGMSIFTALEPEDLASFGMSIVRIHLTHTGRVIEQPASVLLVPTLDPPFKPGWITEMLLPPAIRISAEINSNVFHSAQFRFAIHGSFEEKISESAPHYVPYSSPADDL